MALSTISVDPGSTTATRTLTEAGGQHSPAIVASFNDGTSKPQIVAQATPLPSAAMAETSTIWNGATALTIFRASISAASSGDNTLVAAVTSKKIRVISMFIMSAGTVNIFFADGNDTAICADSTNKIPFIANVGFVLPDNPHGWFETGSGYLLKVNLSSATAIAGCLSYVTV